jgi:hypothetical protein
MSCTQSSTLQDVILITDVTASLLDLDIETTCSLTKLLCFDSAESPAMSSNTNHMSDNTSWRSVETYEAMRGIDINPSYLSYGGRHPEMQGSFSVPINSWRQGSVAPIVTPGDQAKSNYTPTSGASYPNHNTAYQPGGYISPGNSELVPARYTPAASPSVGGVNASSCIPIQHLNTCYAYALDRGNGQYTRLIPADCLPPSFNLARIQGPDGLIILSAPRGQPPLEAFYNTGYDITQPVIGTGRPSSQSSDLVQSTIDSIVANLPQAPKKRPKVYCDKWLHEGVCAFAQQGCRYKHEMPMDKATQHAVGLFNGLPKWYKAKHAVEVVERPPSLSTRSESSPRDGRSALLNGGSWRGGRGGGMLHMHGSPHTPGTSKQLQK